MKGAACLLVALLFLAAIPVLVRCDETLLNEQLALTPDNASRSYKFDLTSGDTISITLGVTGQGLINFHVMNSSDSQLLDKYNIGNQGWQGQWTVPYNDRFEFVIELTTQDSHAANIKLTSSGTGNGGQQGGGGGGFDALPIVVAVILVLAWLVSVFLIIRMRKQPQLPSSPEEPPPPPPA